MKSAIIRPLITEKSMKLAKNSEYTFEVMRSSTKEAIKKVVEKLFKVHVLRIAIVIVKGRTHRTGMKRTESVLPAFKKAIVTVEKGQKIELFEAQ